MKQDIRAGHVSGVLTLLLPKPLDLDHVEAGSRNVVVLKTDVQRTDVSHSQLVVIPAVAPGQGKIQPVSKVWTHFETEESPKVAAVSSKAKKACLRSQGAAVERILTTYTLRRRHSNG